MKKICIGLFLGLFSVYSIADNSSLNLQLPSGASSFGTDKFRAGDLDCSNAIGGATNVEFGMTGIIDNYTGPFDNSNIESTRDVGVYARITIPLDAPKERINCNTLYELELKKKRLEILQLEQELAKLRALQNSGEQQ